MNYKRDNKRNDKVDLKRANSRDNLQTPPYALDPLLPHLDPSWLIWESAIGEGLLAKTLEQKNYQVIATGMETGHNFFEYEPTDYDCQVTNPPYSLKYKWLERSYRLAKPFALLLPLETIGTLTGQNLFKGYGFEFIFFNRRVNFKTPKKKWFGKGAQFPTLWVTWGLNIGSLVTFETIDKKVKRDFHKLARAMSH